MRIPKGRVWQDCRHGALQGIPPGSFCSYQNPITLYNWRQRGSFNVVNLTNKRLTFEGAAIDVGSAVLGDVESLFNHLAEHRAIVYTAANSRNWNSPSWLLVTIYYWGLFAALIWSRLLGKGITYFDSNAIRELKSLYGDLERKVFPGGYCIEFGEKISATSVKFEFVKIKENNFHECVWKHIFKDAKRKFDELADEETDQDEFRIYKCLTFLDKSENRAWPSELRNLINYRSGFSYNASKNHPALSFFEIIKNVEFPSLDSLITQFELATGQISATTRVSTQPNIYCSILFFKTIVLTLLCEELYREILERHNLDSRWMQRREKFYGDLGLVQNNSIWPFQVKS